MPMARITPEQRRALEVLARDPRGATGHLLMIAHGFEMKTLAGSSSTMGSSKQKWVSQ
jgi:hypothetical protein